MGKMDEETYKIIRGMKTIQRQYPKKGESKWYYLDPRGATRIADMGVIDVESEYAPNPYAREILIDDMKRHEEDYYIWRTKGDEKVRASHEEREGKVYNRNLPPDGGNPGEEHNCRCWEEEFKFEKVKEVDIDFSASNCLFFDTQATLSDEDSNIIIEDYAHRRYIFESPKEEKLLKRIGKQIVAREKFIYYAYLDSSGYITSGNGALLNDLRDFQKVHWLYNGRPATKEEISTEYERMHELQKRIQEEAQKYSREHNISLFNPFQKMTAKAYLGGHVLEISRDEADYLMYSHLHKDYINLKRYLPDFDNAPEAAQDVAFDIQYNPGITSSTWTYFKKYFNERNIKELAKQVHRKGVSEGRNNEMRDKILSINKW